MRKYAKLLHWFPYNFFYSFFQWKNCPPISFCFIFNLAYPSSEIRNARLPIKARLFWFSKIAWHNLSTSITCHGELRHKYCKCRERLQIREPAVLLQFGWRIKREGFFFWKGRSFPVAGFQISSRCVKSEKCFLRSLQDLHHLSWERCSDRQVLSASSCRGLEFELKMAVNW